MFTQINPTLKILLLDETKIKSESEIKNPEELIKDAESTTQDFSKAIANVEEQFYGIKYQFSSTDGSCEIIMLKLKYIITSITEGEFLKHSKRFIQLISAGFFEKK